MVDQWFDGCMPSDSDARQSALDPRGFTIGIAVGVPAAVAVAAVMAVFRELFDTTNAALVLMIVVVAVAALGGRTAGVITALAAVVSFDFFHTEPYLSLTIDSRDDIETTILLLIAGVIVGTLAASGRVGPNDERTAQRLISLSPAPFNPLPTHFRRGAV